MSLSPPHLLEQDFAPIDRCSGNGPSVMKTREVRFRITLEIDEKWVSNHTPEEVAEYVERRLSHCLGFRGEVKKVRALKDRKKQSQS